MDVDVGDGVYVKENVSPEAVDIADAWESKQAPAKELH